jgi:hypothetical protein
MSTRPGAYSTKLLSIEQKEEVRRRYPLEGATQMAREWSVTVNCICAVARTMDLRAPGSRGRKKPGRGQGAPPPPQIPPEDVPMLRLFNSIPAPEVAMNYSLGAPAL